MDPDYLIDMGNISGLAHNNGLAPEDDSFHIPIGYELVEQRSAILSGFNGASFYNSSTNTLVVGIAGTNPLNPADLAQDFTLSLGGVPSQVFDAIAFTEDSLNALAARGITEVNLVFTGHSLGGNISQIAIGSHPNASAVVFNSPGLGGLSAEVFPTLFGYSPNVAHVYSAEWGVVPGLVHSNGMLVNNNVTVVPGTSGHSLVGLLAGFPRECFPASTPITISLTDTCPISDIRVGDTVLAFDPSADLGRGALVPRTVTRLYRNTTEEWVRLSWREEGEEKELVTTPGHHVLDRFGNFPMIEEMLAQGRAMVVLASGELTEVMAERIIYSAETAHLFEQAQAEGVVAGSAALKPAPIDAPGLS